MSKLAVIAIGGNSLIKDKDHQTVPDQFQITRQTCYHIAELLKSGWSVIITHGNGPQVGYILRRSELALTELHPVPLDSCDADTQGAIGYMIQQALNNELKQRDLYQNAVTVVTQVVVDKNDSAFVKPSKPIGSFMDEQTAKQRAKNEGWQIVEDAGRGWRRVVPSPIPKEIVELDAIKALVNNHFSVIAVGGGGIPVIRDEKGELKGVEAVIDKDLASSLLARNIGADLFIISTAVDKVALNYKKPDEVKLDKLSLNDAKKYLKEGHFAPGSMGPKIKAIIEFVESTGKEAIITLPENILAAVNEKAGTKVVV